MTPASQSAVLFALAALGFAAMGAALAALAYALGAKRLATWDPRARYAASWVLGGLPLGAAGVLLFSASLPSLAAVLAPALDHCATHDDRHAHLCFTHLPATELNAGAVIAAVLGTGYLLVRGAWALGRFWRARALLGALARTGRVDEALGGVVLETERALCFTAGMWRPRVYVSSGLWRSLGEQERAAMLAHERAHVRRRDPVAACLLRAVAVLHLPWVGKALVREARVAAEQICDEQAAREVGDRLAVAAAILAVERLVTTDAAPREVAMAFAQGDVERRVVSLLSEPQLPRRLGAWWALGACSVLALCAACHELHHATESLLSFVVH